MSRHAGAGTPPGRDKFGYLRPAGDHKRTLAHIKVARKAAEHPYKAAAVGAVALKGAKMLFGKSVTGHDAFFPGEVSKAMSPNKLAGLGRVARNAPLRGHMSPRRDINLKEFAERKLVAAQAGRRGSVDVGRDATSRTKIIQDAYSRTKNTRRLP